MKKRSILNSVEVKSPCSQSWESMYGNDVVRFCEHCVKHVHNLSAMTRRDAEKFVARSKGDICIQYVRRPDGKVQTMSDKLYQISGRASRLAAGVFGASLSLATAVMAQTETAPSPPPAQEEVLVKGEMNALVKEKTANSIYGTILDTNGAAIVGAEITLTNRDTGAEQAVASDGAGNYIFSPVEKGKYKLLAKSLGFANKEIENIEFSSGDETNIIVALPPQTQIQSVIMGGAMAVFTEYKNSLIRAVAEGDIDRIQHLIAAGADVNAKDENEGITALHLAVDNGDLEIIQMLLNAGAKVNVRDEERQTPIMRIAQGYYGEAETDEDGNEIKSDDRETRAVKIFRLLITYGAKINLRDSDGFTALMFAAQNEEPELLRILISHRADINFKAKNGRTALMEAADSDQFENVKILLEAGAEVNLKDDEGETAWDLTTESKIEDLLVSYGAIVDEEDEEEPEDN